MFKNSINLISNENHNDKITDLISRYGDIKSKLLKNNHAKLNNGHNIWIMKPVDKSKGIGIEVKQSLNTIIKCILNNQER